MSAQEPGGTLREKLLAIARSLPEFAECDPAKTVTVVFRCDGTRLRLRIDPARIGASHTDLSPMEQDLLRVATNTPQSPKALARLAGKTMGSHVSKALTALCRKGLLVRLPDGYCRSKPA